MKKFKDFVKSQETPTVAFNSHGAHARLRSQETSTVAFNSHGAHAKRRKTVSESESQHISTFLNDDRNVEHLGPETDRRGVGQLEKLHELHPLHPESKPHLHRYTKYSADLNKALLDAHKNNKPAPTQVFSHNVPELDKSFTPSKVHLHTYSGIGFNPRKLDMVGKSKAGNPVFKSPTYMSSTHKKPIALGFARDAKPYDEDHNQVMHIETHPGQKIGVIGKHSEFDHEQETTIPRDEHYEHLGSNVYHDPRLGYSYEVHHVRRIPESEVIKNK